MTPSSGTSSPTLAARLERLPMTPYLWALVLVAGGAWFVESLSIGATGVILPVLKPLWHLTAGQVGLLAVSSTIGVVVGLIPAGRIGDHIGRVRLLTYGIWVYSGLTLLSSLSPNFDTLVLLRILAGLGMGAVFPLPYSIVSEFVSRHRRTWLSGILDACLSVGYFVAPLLGLVILPHVAPALSWRLFLVAAGLPLLYALVVKRVMPESPRWLWQQGRRQEALAAIAPRCDLVLVVGSATSSNSRRLVEVAERLGVPAHLVDDSTDIDLDWLQGVSTIGITAGVSAPESDVTQVVRALGGLGALEVVTEDVRRESVTFPLPLEVR
jgi:MFS family permease